MDFAPPPPPPPPPPPSLKPKKEKKKDFREIMALFHEESGDAAKTKRAWTALWQTTLAEAQEEHKRRRLHEQHGGLKRKKMGEKEHGPSSGRGSLSRHGSLAQDHLKRARQGSTASTDSSESNKATRLGGRIPKNAPKGSKLLQKFGGRN